MSPQHLLELVASIVVAGVTIPAAQQIYRRVVDRRDARRAESETHGRHALVAPWDDPTLTDMWGRVSTTVVDVSFDGSPWLHEAAAEADALSSDLTYTAFDRRCAAALNALLEATNEQYALPGRERREAVGAPDTYELDWDGEDTRTRDADWSVAA